MGLVRASLVAASAIAMVGVLATPAEALFVRPTDAPLLSAGGVDSGCVATAQPRSLKVRDSGEQMVRSGAVMICDASWARAKVYKAVDEVMPDGSVERIQPMGWFRLSSYTNPGSAWGLETLQPCDGLPGTHTYIDRYKFKVKASKASTDPYIARVDVKSTITCPA
jgi:hypothetical protein